MIVRIFAVLLLSCTAYTLYEDQIGKFDWRQQYIGNVKDYVIGQTDMLYVASDSHVLGALNQNNGSLVWRQVLEESGLFLSIKQCGKYLFTLSLRKNPLLRAWNPGSGHIVSELLLNSNSTDGKLVCGSKEDSLYITLADQAMRFDLYQLAVSAENAFFSSLHKNSKVLDSSEQDEVVTMVFGKAPPTNAISVTKWNSKSIEVDLVSFQISAPADVLLEECILTQSAVVCRGQNSQLMSAKLEKEATFHAVDLSSKPTELVKHIDGRVFVQQASGRVEVFSVEKSSWHLKPEYKLDGATAFALTGNKVICVKQLKDKYFENLQVAAYDASSGRQESSGFPEFLNLSRNHGRVREVAVAPSGKGLLLITEERAIQMISAEGDQKWLREEALADISAVEMIDLPVSAQDATMQEEFGQSNAGVLKLFINRIRSQAHQLSVAWKAWRSGEFGALVKTADGDEFTPLTRDVHNLHKMLLVVTSVGKIFGIESSRGRIVWKYFVSGTRVHGSSSASNSQLQRQHLFAQRSTGHFPLTPVACVLLEDTESVSRQPTSLLLYLDPTLGVPLDARSLKPLDSDADAIVRLPKRIKLAVLVPKVTGVITRTTGSEEAMAVEASSHIQPLCVMLEDNSVRLFPPALGNVNQHELLPERGLYVFTLNEDPASVSGYRVEAASNHSVVANALWHMHLSSTDSPQRILHAAVHPSNEHVHSIGRVLGDRNVLYKYINPNLLAVMTAGEIAAEEGLPTVTLYLIDTVAGQIVHSVVHKRATEPTSLVVSENWVLYSVYNQRSLRTEFTVMELFEPLHTATSLVPSPWAIFRASLLPSDAQTAGTNSRRLFSSLDRAAQSAHGGGGDGSGGVLIPEMLQRVFILASPIRPGALAVSLTERGITAKSLIFGLETGNLLELPKSLLDPRRTLEMTPQLQEEGLEPYAPELPMSTLSIISYNQTLERIRRIHTAPSGLESTSLVFAHGLDLFFTRVAPSKTYDMLRDDFDHWFIAMIVVGMAVGSYVTKRLSARRELAKAWR